MKHLLFASLIALSSFAAHAGSFISQNGQTIVDSTGKSIQLKGVNLGGWLLWEGWIWGGSFTSQGDIKKNLTTIAGQTEYDAFEQDVYHNFINENDIKAISELNFNVVRVPLNNRLFDTSYTSIGWHILDTLLLWCQKYHVYAVIDIHACPGGQSNFFTADPLKPNVWKSPSYQAATINLWKKIAARYKNKSIIAGYDLLNEPIPPDGKTLVNLYDSIIKAIRAIDVNHMMILEGGNFARNFDYFTKLPDNNMMFSFHIYTWFGGQPKDKMTPFAQLRQRLDVPVWCGEWGENNYDYISRTLDAFNMPDNKFVGWCFWTWKKVPNSYPALNGIAVTNSWKDVITWCGRPRVSKTPQHDLVIASMNEFRKAMRYENTTHDYQMGEMLKKDAAVK